MPGCSWVPSYILAFCLCRYSYLEFTLISLHYHAFREFYQAQGEIRRKAAYETAEKIKRDAKANMKQAKDALDVLLKRLDPFGALGQVIEAARQAIEAAENAFLDAAQRANQMIIAADREYEKFLMEKLDLVLSLDERAFPPGWEGVWKSHIKSESINSGKKRHWFRDIK